VSCDGKQNKPLLSYDRENSCGRKVTRQSQHENYYIRPELTSLSAHLDEKSSKEEVRQILELYAGIYEVRDTLWTL
jgi:hypothetical protein